MYKQVIKEDLDRIAKIGYISISKLGPGAHRRSIRIRNHTVQKLSKELFRFNHDMGNNTLTILDFINTSKINDPREFEQFSVATLLHFMQIAKGFNLQALAVESTDSRILESFYNLQFKSINIAEAKNGKKIYSATKQLY